MSYLIDQSLIRNFSIIAHIDHGKSTLADRILQLTGTVADRDMKNQILDDMDLERERGITIKLNAVQLTYKAKDGKTYLLHLIDTPGHVDFSYEVSRSLAACDGAVLVVDATQGVEAQTLANVYLALDNNLEILPVINKVDLPSADVERVKEEIEDVIGLDAQNAPCISAKTGLNVDEVLEDIVKNIPAPTGSINNPTQALIFDSYYDSYRGVIVIVAVKDGSIKVGDHIHFIATDATYEVTEVGVRTPREITKDELVTGEVGWIAASVKDIKDVHVGDTITTLENQSKTARYKDLRDALEKISLSDSALTYEPETSQALGFGFRCGFLGLLHMDVIQERLEREFDLDLIATAPSVIYRIVKRDGSYTSIDNPASMPDPGTFDHIEEPYVKVSIMTPDDYIGAIMDLCQNKRGEYVDIEYLDDSRREVIYNMPLSEIVFDFFDKLKSSTKGYASYDYELIGYRESDLTKMDILLNGEVVDALSTIVYRQFARTRGNAICVKLKELIPKQQFEIPVQAALQGKIIARTNIKAVRKNVLAKCYGGDISRKKKLLEKQKEGKKRMKAVGSVEIPQEAFMAILSVDE